MGSVVVGTPIILCFYIEAIQRVCLFSALLWLPACMALGSELALSIAHRRVLYFFALEGGGFMLTSGASWIEAVPCSALLCSSHTINQSINQLHNRESNSSVYGG